jgi:hypothetical protein
MLSVLVLTVIAIFGCSDKSTDVRVARSNVDFHRGPVDDGLSIRPHPDPRAENPVVTLRGVYIVTVDSCYILAQDEGGAVELQFSNEVPAPDYPVGTRVEVTGQYALRLGAGSRCLVGPILMVQTIIKLPGDKENPQNVPAFQ